jgi:hypothetical protein
MHVTDPVTLTKEGLEAQTMIRCPGVWDVLGRIKRASGFRGFMHCAAAVKGLRDALQHWTEPHIVGERVAGWIDVCRVDQYGHREDLALIEPACLVASGSEEELREPRRLSLWAEG